MTKTIRLIIRIAFVGAAVWSVFTSARIFFTPVTITVQQATTNSSEDPERSSAAEATTEERSWYQTQGLWGVIVLFIFAGMYTVAAAAAWTQRDLAAVLISLAAILLTWLAGFSIGGAYLPSALAVLIGVMLILISRIGGSFQPQSS